MLRVAYTRGGGRDYGRVCLESVIGLGLELGLGFMLGLGSPLDRRGYL